MMARSTRLLLIAGLLLSTAACVVTYRAPAPRPAPPPVRADVGFFYDALTPHGTWVHLQPHGWVWYPRHVSAGWRPYSEGRWVYSDYGWTWVSDLEWGWAPFHYGRWVVDRRYGWTWIPGKEWGPAWVAWRHGGGWVGWSPLPPQARWRAGVGLDLRGVNLDVAIQSSWWCFVEERRLLEPRIGRVLTVPSRNATIVRATRNVTNYAVVNRRVVNRSIGVEPIQRVVRRPVPRYRVVDAGASGKEPRSRLQGREVRVFRPVAGPTSTRRAPVAGRKAPTRPAPPTENPATEERRAPRQARPEHPPSDTAPREDSAKTRKAEKVSLEESQAKEKPEVEQEPEERRERTRPPRGRKKAEKKKQLDKPPEQD